MPREHWEQFSKLMKLLLKASSFLFIYIFLFCFYIQLPGWLRTLCPTPFVAFTQWALHPIPTQLTKQLLLSFIIECYTIIHCTQSYGFCGVLHCNQPFLLLYFNMTYWTFTEELLSKVLSGKTQGFVTFSHRSNECLLVISLTAFKGNLKIKNLQKGLQYVGKCLRRWLSMLTLKYYPI